MCKDCRRLQRFLKSIGSEYPDLVYSCCRRRYWAELERERIRGAK